MARKKNRQRDYKLEYQRRKAKGLAKGMSLRQSRGHPGPGEARNSGAVPVDPANALEKALKAMKVGMSQKDAAALYGVSVEKLRRYLHENTKATREGRGWSITDIRPVAVAMATGGEVIVVSVTHDVSSAIGRHWNAINKFIEGAPIEVLADFRDRGVKDQKRRFYLFETRPNVLRKLASVGDLSFVELYANVAGEA